MEIWQQETRMVAGAETESSHLQIEAWNKREQAENMEMLYNRKAHLQWCTYSSKLAPPKSSYMAPSPENLANGDRSDLLNWKHMTYGQTFYQPHLRNHTLCKILHNKTQRKFLIVGYINILWGRHTLIS